MIISQHNVVLTKVTEADLELIREKRNSSEIKSRMFYQKDITKEEQKDWFKKINSSENFYFIISDACNKIGMINVKNIDYPKRTAEGGIMIWENKYKSTPFPIIAALLIQEFSAHFLDLEKAYSKIRPDNIAAINFNRLIGYQKIKEEDNLYYIDKENFKKSKVGICNRLGINPHDLLHAENMEFKTVNKLFFGENLKYLPSQFLSILE
jgi:RimJ/RimL family protein N-acetyltransferase